jgi:hypothetical protein
MTVHLDELAGRPKFTLIQGGRDWAANGPGGELTLLLAPAAPPGLTSLRVAATSRLRNWPRRRKRGFPLPFSPSSGLGASMAVIDKLAGLTPERVRRLVRRSSR